MNRLVVLLLLILLVGCATPEVEEPEEERQFQQTIIGRWRLSESSREYLARWHEPILESQDDEDPVPEWARQYLDDIEKYTVLPDFGAGATIVFFEQGGFRAESVDLAGKPWFSDSVYWFPSASFDSLEFDVVEPVGKTSMEFLTGSFGSSVAPEGNAFSLLSVTIVASFRLEGAVLLWQFRPDFPGGTSTVFNPVMSLHFERVSVPTAVDRNPFSIFDD